MVATCDKIGNRKVYGIDLGTTYSAISVVNEVGQAEIVKNAEGDRKTASAVFFEPSGEYGKPNVVVGSVSKLAGREAPDHFVEFIKRHMGSSSWRRDIEGISWTPEMISSEIIKKLVKDAEAHGERINDVVVAYPCYYGSFEKQALSAAWRLAGLDVSATVNEPTAAVLHYGVNLADKPQTAIVYHLGGATFCVSVLNVSGNSIDVVCSDGDLSLGGKDWDERIAQYFAEKFAEENGISADELLGDPEACADLRDQAEITKCLLSRRTKVTQKICYGSNLSRVEITRDDFDALTKPLLDRTELKTQDVIAHARTRGVTKFDRFLLVGGSTYMPQVMEMVRTKFGALLERDPEMLDPDEAVAKGAAIYGTLNVKNEFSLGLPDNVEVTSGVFREVSFHSYGIQVLDSSRRPKVCNLIREGALLPAEGELDVPVTDGDGRKLSVKVFENDNPSEEARMTESTLIGETEIVLPPNLPAEEWYTLTLHALDISSGTTVQAVFGVGREIASCEIADLNLE